MTDDDARPGPPITGDPAEFIDLLEDGDVLLLAVLRTVGHLIRLFENSPVNHVALYRETDRMVVEATYPRRDNPHAVQEQLVAKAVGAAEVRTVTAMRLRSGGLGPKVIRQATARVGDGSGYKFKWLSTLAAMCLDRAYRSGTTEPTVSKHTGPPDDRQLLQMLNAVAETSDLYARHETDGRRLLTCSEFAYICYAEAGADIEIRDPLSMWGEPDTTTGHVPLRFLSHHGDPLPPPEAPEFTETFADHLARQRLALAEMLGNPDPSAVRPEPGRDYRPVAETVTPFDLWQSRSLYPAVVLHRPPVDHDPVYERGDRRH